MPLFNDKRKMAARMAVAAGLLAIGAAGGAGAVALTRPSIEMAPTMVTPIARLAASSGIVTIKGRVAGIYGDRALIEDGSGKAMVDLGRDGAASLKLGGTALIQGRYDDGQLRGSFLIGPQGNVEAIGPGPRRPRPGPHDGPEGREPPAAPPAPGAYPPKVECAAPPPPPAAAQAR